MQTRLPAPLLDTTDGRLADSILRSCVHCGFCTATCPTFLLTGNELDSPRGRIYLIKEMLEKDSASIITRNHLDRCLSCQSCETTCPSSVSYHTLLDIGRRQLAGRAGYGLVTVLKRTCCLAVLGSRTLFALAVSLGRMFRFILPSSLARQLPGRARFSVTEPAAKGCTRKVVLLKGCVQDILRPDTSRAASRVLARLGIGTVCITGESCCGAMHYHSDQQEQGLLRARRLVDQLLAALDQGAQAILSTASGCGNFIKDYQSIFRNDPVYRDKAARLEGVVMDIAAFLQQEDIESLPIAGRTTLVFHSPCTLQHGQQLAGVTENVLARLGFDLPAVKNSHLCCGSAGTYALFQPQMARSLRDEKILALENAGGEAIATANIGCQCHLAGATRKPVRHWIEYVAEGLRDDG